MMTLYIKVGCPYCMKVQKAVEKLGIAVAEKKISDQGVWDEVVRLGGKHQVPFLVDEERGTSLYDSSAIVRYLCEHYDGDAESFDHHVDHSVCPVV